MDVTIRPATLEDIPAIIPIARESQEKHAQAHPDLFRSDTPGFTAEYMQFLVEDDTHTIYVAELDQRVIGYVFLSVSTRTFMEVFYPHIIAYISDIAVSETFQRQGIGRLLFNKSVEWAKSRNAEHLELTVWEFNAQALAFYRRNGMHTLNRSMSMRLAAEKAEGNEQQ